MGVEGEVGGVREMGGARIGERRGGRGWMDWRKRRRGGGDAQVRGLLTFGLGWVFLFFSCCLQLFHCGEQDPHM